MKKPVLAIFDMDGVLVDSEDTFKHACADALHEFNVYPEYDEFTKYTGMGDIIYIGGVSEAHGVPYCTEMSDRSYALYAEYAKTMLKIFPWSRPIIENIKAAGYKVCVASSAGLFKVKTNISCIGVGFDTFDTVVCGDEVVEKKPAPDIFLKAAEKLNVKPCDCIVFEDAIAGVKAAKSAGMTAIAVTTSFSEEELKDAGADYICNNLMEAAKIYFGI